MTSSRFREVEREGVRVIAWVSDRFPTGTVAAFSTRVGGVSPDPYATLNLGAATGDDPARVAENRTRFFRAAGAHRGEIFYVAQVHGADVLPADPQRAEVTSQTAGGQSLRRAGRGDGLVTDRPNRFLVTFHADCLPIFLLDPVARVAALLHAGWRGTLAGVARSGVEAAVAAGADRRRLLAGIGPGIGPCCYEVDEPVIQRVRDVFGPDGAAPLLRPGRRGHAYLDLWRANLEILTAAGIPAENVAVAGLCTSCREDLFFSHRRARGGPTGRMMAVLGLAGPSDHEVA